MISPATLPRVRRLVSRILWLALGLTTVLRAQSGLPAPFDIDPTPEHPRSSEGSFVTLRSGRILFDYSQFTGGGQDFSPSAIAEISSDDQGKTWSAPKVVIPTAPYSNIMSVSFLRLADGRIARFYAVKTTKWLDCQPVVTFSSDEGATWTQPKRITQAPGYFVLNNDRVIQTKSGRLIVPTAFHRSRDTADDRSAWDDHGIAIWFVSDDAGATWKEAASWWGLPVVSGSGLQEPGVVQLKDDSLYSWCRTDVGYQYGMRSSDNGTTWSEPVQTTLSSPNSPASIKALPGTNTLMVVYNDHSGAVPKPEKANRRAPLVLRFSNDGAKSWSAPQVIESDLGGWYCYTAIHFTKDEVLLAYVAGNDQLGHLSRLRIRRIPLSALQLPKP